MASLIVVISFDVSLARAEDAAAQPAAPAARFFYGGQITDAAERAIEDVEVTATYRDPVEQGEGFIDTVKSDPNGQFVIDRAMAMSGATPASTSRCVIRLTFKHRGYVLARLEDLNVLGPTHAANLHIILSEGRSIVGRVIDGNGRPVAGALVESAVPNATEHRKAAVTDAEGRFTLSGLPPAAAELRVRTIDPEQPMLTGKQAVAATATDVGLIKLILIELPADKRVHELFGMKLVDVDPALQASFHLPRADGVLVLDPGEQSDRLKIGKLQRGDVFCVVGDHAITNYADFTARLRHAVTAEPAGRGWRVVYAFSRPESEGTNTQFIRLGRPELAELAAAAKDQATAPPTSGPEARDVAR